MARKAKKPIKGRYRPRMWGGYRPEVAQKVVVGLDFGRAPAACIIATDPAAEAYRHAAEVLTGR
jgi:hypothetical protein